jgi:hypothetical protein
LFLYAVSTEVEGAAMKLHGAKPKGKEKDGKGKGGKLFGKKK